MKKTSIGLLAMLTIPGFAQDASYPVLRPVGCTQNIVTPEGVNAQYYLSRDCKVAYILPSEVSPMKISSMRKGAAVTEAHCDLVNEMSGTVKDLNRAITTLRNEQAELRRVWRNKIDQAPLDQTEVLSSIRDRAIAEGEKNLSDLNELRNQAVKLEPYGKLEGAVMNVHMSLAHANDVRKYQEANASTGILFQAARISNGVLSFGTSKGNDQEINTQSVIGFRVPGISAMGRDVFSDSNHIILNGGASGVITLSQPTVCRHVRELDKAIFSPEKLTKDNIGASGFVAHYTYDVPVTTNTVFEMTAETTPKDLKSEFNAYVIDGEFTQEKVSDLLMTGTLASQISIKFTDGGRVRSATNLDSDDIINLKEDTIYTKLYNQGMDLYLEKVLSKMEETGTILNSVNTPVEVKEGREVITENVVSHCRWKTNWYGKSKKKCSSYVVRDRVFMPGKSTVMNSAQDDVALKFNFKVDMEDTMTMRHTTALTERGN